MKTKEALGCSSLLLSVFFAIPIRIYIMYVILSKVGVDRLVWFLFWFSVPIHVLLEIISEIVKKSKD